MAFASIFFALFVLSRLVLLHKAHEGNNSQSICPASFECGPLGLMKFPFTNITPPLCGLCMVDCEEKVPLIQLERWPKVELLNASEPNTIHVRDLNRQKALSDKNCLSFTDFQDYLYSPAISFKFSPNMTFFRCYNISRPELTQPEDVTFRGYYSYRGCQEFSIYYKYPKNPVFTPPASLPPHCSVILLPFSGPRPNLNVSDPFSLMAVEFSLEFHVSDECLKCHSGGGQCKTHNRTNEFYCEGSGKNHKILILASVIPGALVLIISLGIVIIWLLKMGYYYLCIPSSKTSSDPSSKPDLEGGGIFFGVPVFSYRELEEATNYFDPSNELGDGGFGTVYHGKLSDGREVAVKRLYQHNYKRVEQFKNEIKILTRLRHRNLVSLYGCCTSRQSCELLLVYEYIPNGTVGDHLHGERAEAGSLTWPVRMNIAIETAGALAYLHASDIIHRDVKTTNILLDNNFCVKVADFGLSRLFPNDVTHVSTAPQGTPGYVDPEYHQCYQLTDKSDVYSFGVVLVELISSMPAVDISRHRYEINLANLAINRIQRCAFDELIDSSLGFESDDTVRRMSLSVAELAFRCLQLDKELRPTMDEVFKALKEIKGEEHSVERTEEADGSFGGSASARQPASPESEDLVLLKNMKSPLSPISMVDHLWTSGSITTSSSG